MARGKRAALAGSTTVKEEYKMESIIYIDFSQDGVCSMSSVSTYNQCYGRLAWHKIGGREWMNVEGW